MNANQNLNDSSEAMLREKFIAVKKHIKNVTSPRDTV